MSSSQDTQNRTLRAKKSGNNNPPSLTNPGHSGPTTFFLRSEKDMEKRGRRTSRSSTSKEGDETMEKTPLGSMMADSSFGVESLESTINSTSSDTLSRTDSNLSEASVEAGADASVVAGRKRKAGNPVHPKIAAAGQRIISAEQPSGSPVSLRSTESPMRYNGRRVSISSSINLSQPITPLKMSPQPESAMPSTPRSGSPKSFRLSDEEASVASDTNSQAVQSSSGEDDGAAVLEDDDKTNSMPQLVMPSIAMPTRRPFTEKGKRMGRLKIMVVGAKGVGKTSLIQSICRACEDIVHLDPLPGPAKSKDHIDEIGASTRPYPSWWTDFEARRQLLQRKSIGDGVLERNVTFIDTPGFDRGRNVEAVLRHFKTSLARMGSLSRMHDSEIISTLSGEGGLQIDAVLYVFDSAPTSEDSPEHLQMDQEQSLLLQYLCQWTNVIPVISRGDAVDADQLVERKKQLLEMFKRLSADVCIETGEAEDSESNNASESSDKPFEPYAISSAVGDDPEMIDASVLMSSGYLQPLIPSELDVLVKQLLEPDNMARLRHLSATKFLLWRQEHLAAHIDFERQAAWQSPELGPRSASERSTNETLDESSKVLVPHSSSSRFRSTSPSASFDSGLSSNGNAVGTSAYALARLTDNASPSEPFRQVRLAKWAQDLQRSLDNERRRYKQMYMANMPSGWTSNTPYSASSPSEKASDPNTSLVTATGRYPAKGRLGGDLGVIDPRDPLGVLAFGQAFRRNGLFALQLAGFGGLIGAAVWWISRNWIELQEFLNLGWGQQTTVSVTAMSPPSRSWTEEAKNFFGFGA